MDKWLKNLRNCMVKLLQKNKCHIKNIVKIIFVILFIFFILKLSIILNYLSKYITYLIQLSIFLLLIPSLISGFSWLKKNKLEFIEIKGEKVVEAQKEIGILSNFLMSNAQKILWIRGILLTILMAIVGYTLKECYMGCCNFLKYENKILLLSYSVVIIAFLLELFEQVAQASLTNRVYQLDNAINKKLLYLPIESELFRELVLDRLQKIFVPKGNFDPTKTSDLLIMICTALQSPKFFLFYIVILLFLLLFSYLLGNP